MSRLRRRVVMFTRKHVGIRTCAFLGHGRPVLAEVEVKVRDRVPPAAVVPGASGPRTELGVVCRRCGTRTGD